MRYDEAREQAREQETEESLRRKLLRAEARATDAWANMRTARATVAEREDTIEELSRELNLYQEDFSARPEWLKTPTDETEHHGILLTCLSDTHYGEVVHADEMAGYNAYDMKIAELRTRRYFERVILMARQYLAGTIYDGVTLALGGDIANGDIHAELTETNEVPLYEVIETVVPWLAAGIEMFVDEFGLVHVVSVPGNHGRNTWKPRYKHRSANNADTHIARLVAREFKNETRVTFDIPAAMTVDFDIYDTAFRLEHGDEAKGGTGIQAALAPLALRAHRIRKQAQAEGRPFDALMVGHWHQLMSLPAQGFIVNGSLKGYDEYARGKGFAPEPPQQFLCVVTPEHGIGTQVGVRVAKRSSEGW